MDLNCECESSIAPIIMGVIIGILGVAIAIGASGLIIGTFIVKKHRYIKSMKAYKSHFYCYLGMYTCYWYILQASSW